MSDPRLDYLFYRHLAKKTSAAEQEELFELMGMPANEQQANDLMGFAWEGFQPGERVFGAAQSRTMLQQILAVGSDVAGESNLALVDGGGGVGDADDVVTPVRRKMGWIRVAAAVIFLLAAAGGVFIYSRRGKEGGQVVSSRGGHIKDIDPGHNGAVLTLSNGQQVVLDSTQNGNLTSQGGVQLTKSNGQLVYAATGNGDEIVYNTMSTTKGRQYQLVMSDGTRVWLNASSSIRYPAFFKGKERRVEITGEVYLEVASNASQPFFVHVVSSSAGRSCDLQVLGTSFNVNAYDDEELTRTTLVEGSVRVKGSHSEALLLPGHQSRVGDNGSMSVAKDADVDAVLAWKNGVFTFDNTGVRTIMNQLARWYDIDVEYKDGFVPNDSFWGEIPRSEKLSSVLNVLTKSGIRFNVEGRKVVVLKDSK